MRRVEVLNTERLLDDFFVVDAAELRFERFDGTMSDRVRRLTFERGDSVAALLVLVDTDRVVLANQFKFPTFAKGPGWIVETVAGAIDEGESPDESVRREITEETGFVADRLELISTFYLSPGGSSERVFLFYAESESDARVSDGGGVAAEHEDIQTLELEPSELFEMLDAGAIADAKTIVACHWYRRRREVAA